MEGIKFEKVSFEEFKRAYLTVDIFASDEEIKEYYDRIKLPKRSTSGSAGYDFIAPYQIDVNSGLSDTYPTGIKVKMPKDVALMLFTRSSLGFFYGIRLANTVGIVDSDYYNNERNEGQIFVKYFNFDKYSMLTVQAGEKYMQGIFIHYLTTEDDDTTQERVGGIGSTGK